MELCKTDIQTIIKYLNDAAIVYDKKQGKRMGCGEWILKRLIKKLIKKE